MPESPSTEASSAGRNSNQLAVSGDAAIASENASTVNVMATVSQPKPGASGGTHKHDIKAPRLTVGQTSSSGPTIDLIYGQTDKVLVFRSKEGNLDYWIASGELSNLPLDLHGGVLSVSPFLVRL